MNNTHDRATVLVFEGAGDDGSSVTVKTPGVMPPLATRVVTPTSRHAFKNKILTDPSNIIAATSLSIGGEPAVFPVTPAAGTVLTYDGADVTWAAPVVPAPGTATPYGRDVYTPTYAPAPTLGTAFGAEACQFPYEFAGQYERTTAFGYRAQNILASPDAVAVGAYATAQHTAPGDLAGTTVVGYINPPSGPFYSLGTSVTRIGNATSQIFQFEDIVAIGHNAFVSVRTASQQTVAFGWHCGTSVFGLNGWRMSLFGAECLSNAQAGNFNAHLSTVFGYNALKNPQSPASEFNRGPTVFGALAGENATNANANTHGQHTLCGFSAGIDASEYPACALGYYALRRSSAPGNVAIGSHAGYHIEASEHNTCVGADSGPADATVTHSNTLVGYKTYCDGGSGNVVIGCNSNAAPGAVGTIAIGNNITDAPSARLVFGSDQSQVETNTTVGAAGPADALPASPHTWMYIVINGVEYVTPLYAPVPP